MILFSKVNVFPVPAPAIIIKGARGCLIAASCFGFAIRKISS